MNSIAKNRYIGCLFSSSIFQVACLTYDVVRSHVSGIGVILLQKTDFEVGCLAYNAVRSHVLGVILMPKTDFFLLGGATFCDGHRNGVGGGLYCIT